MLADLNGLLAAHARGEDTTDAFRDFMDKHGDLFPEQPEDVDELIDALARRQAAADRMMASLSPEQREQLGQLMSEALSDPTWPRRWPSWPTTCGPCGPAWSAARSTCARAGEPLGYSDAVEAVAELADLEALEQSSGAGRTRRHPRRRRRGDAWSSSSGGGGCRRLPSAARARAELERQGFVSRGDDGLRLTPRGGPSAGRDRAEAGLLADRGRRDAGDHQDRRTGSADEPAGSTRPWVFGDELPIDAVRTVSNALLRRGSASPVPAAGRGLRGRRDRAADHRRRGAVRRPVLLDGAPRAAGVR